MCPKIHFEQKIISHVVKKLDHCEKAGSKTQHRALILINECNDFFMSFLFFQIPPHKKEYMFMEIGKGDQEVIKEVDQMPERKRKVQ